jgi:hypothetical protein
MREFGSPPTPRQQPVYISTHNVPDELSRRKISTWRTYRYVGLLLLIGTLTYRSSRVSPNLYLTLTP